MGFSGGFTNTQGPHLLTTFSAIQAICLIGTEKAFSLLNPSGLYRYLVGLKHPSSDGTFRVHEHGEHDIR